MSVDVEKEKSVVLVTGCSRGIGSAICLLLAKSGFSHIAVTARSIEDAQALAHQIGPAARGFQLDITSDESGARETEREKVCFLLLLLLVINCVARVSSEFNAPIAFVVNNAGGHYDNGAHCAELTPKEFEDAFQVNTLGHIRVIQAVLPSMRARKFGRIVNLTSRAGSFAGTWKNAPAYGVSKCAMNMYVMMLAHDLKDSGVLVNACCPGWVRTRMGGEDATYSVDEVGVVVVFVCY
jgi:NAD(P)-dependent dehydrogenase (short-subunit alcohol dehydrogenase family)